MDANKLTYSIVCFVSMEIAYSASDIYAIKAIARISEVN